MSFLTKKKKKLNLVLVPLPGNQETIRSPLRKLIGQRPGTNGIYQIPFLKCAAP